MQKLSIVIPAYNEAHRIGETLFSIDQWLKQQKFEYEILVVNDGSKDSTSEVVNSLIPKIKNLKLIDNKENHGKGWVVRQGMLAATGDVRLFTDADNSTSIDQAEKMLPFFDQGFNVVIGSIEVSGAQINEHAQWYRRALGHWSKFLIRFVAGIWEIHDTQRGFKFFSAKASVNIFSRLRISKFGFDFEALAIAKHLGYKIKELPVVWNNQGESKVSLKSYITTFWDLAKVRMNLWSGKYN